MTLNSEKHYPWNRFWYDAGKTFNYDQYGFLQDPAGEYGSILNPNLTTLDALQDERCLILLGEAGLGKSQALNRHYIRISTETKNPDIIRWVDLRDIADSFQFSRHVFDASWFREWAVSNNKLVLFLDSFDEGLIAFETVFAFLAEELRELSRAHSVVKSVKSDSAAVGAGPAEVALLEQPVDKPLDRLYLRIASRPGAWRRSFSEELEKSFKPAGCKTLKLAPLRRKDVEIAALQEDAHSFVEQVISRRVVPFSINPFTLKALLSCFKKHKSLPKETLIIYSEVCRVAATEYNPSRVEKRRAGYLTMEECLRIARRIAALTVFTNKATVCTDLPLDGLRPEELGADAIYGMENDRLYKIRVDAERLREVLDKALFSWRSERTVGWSHRTYSEFLAAEYCKAKALSVREIRKLIFAEALGEKRIAPQLYETVGWLCLFYPNLTSAVVKNDPTALIFSDALNHSDSVRFSVTESYLQRFEREEQFRDQLGDDELARLRHPRLADQLRSYITDRRKKAGTRLKAMDIADACEIVDLAPYLVSVALDSTEVVHLRSHAIVVLSRIGTSDSRGRLRELLKLDKAEDPQQEIKGWTLFAVWPSHLSITELFDALVDQNDPGLVGGYSHFLHSLPDSLPEHLTGEKLLVALRWVDALPYVPDHRDSFQPVIDCVLMKAWDSFDDPAVQSLFVRIVLKRISHHEPLVQGSLSARHKLGYPFAQCLSVDREKRRKLLAALTFAMATSPGDTPAAYILSFSPDRIVREEDAEWLIKQLRSADESHREITFSLLERMAFGENLAVIREGIDQGILPLARFWSALYIDLHSQQADLLRQQHEFEVRRGEPRPLIKPSPQERISDCLARIMKDEVIFWSQLTLDMTLQPDSEYYGEEGNDLRKLPGWIEAGEATRAEIVAAAVAFLQKYTPDPTHYWQKTFGHWVIAAYLALVLILEEDQSLLERQNEEFWKRWSGLVISYRFDHREEIYQRLLEIIAEKYPSAIAAGLREVLVPEQEDCNFIGRLGHVWSEEIENTLVDTLRSGALALSCDETILKTMLAHDSMEGRAIAESAIRNEHAPERQIMAATAMLESAPDGGEGLVLPLIQHSEELGRKIIERVSNYGGKVAFAEKWSEDALATLFLWIEARYPRSEDPKEDGQAHFVGVSESIRLFRDALLRYLQHRGTVAAISSLTRIQRELKFDWIKWYIAEAKAVARWNAWEPIKPAALLELSTPSELLGARWQNYFIAVLTGMLASYVVNLATPQAPDLVLRLGLAFTSTCLIIALFESQRSDGKWLLPFWLLAATVSLLFLMFRVLRLF